MTRSRRCCAHDRPLVRLVAYADGASRGNPGPAAYGGALYSEAGVEVRAVARAIGRGTNNDAEYQAAIAVLEAALEMQATEVELRLDSELVVRQITGIYRVRSERLRGYYDRVLALIEQLERFHVHHIPREQNRRADALANGALDGRPASAP